MKTILTMSMMACSMAVMAGCSAASDDAETPPPALAVPAASSELAPTQRAYPSTGDGTVYCDTWGEDSPRLNCADRTPQPSTGP